MGPTSFTGIVYETSIDMSYFFGAHTSCELAPAGLGPLRTQQQPQIQASLLIPRPIWDTNPADPSNTGTACESNDDCAPGICGEDGTCQPRDLACFSDADCFDDEYCAFPSGSSTIPPCRRLYTCVLGRGMSTGQECIDGRCFVITIATRFNSCDCPQMSVTAKPDLQRTSKRMLLQ